jgi:hypothetical protein
MSQRITWFIPVKHRNYNKMSASIWIRCLQLLPYLEDKGIRCKVNKPDAEADIAVFVRWQDESALEIAQRQKKQGRRIAFDLCVNYFDETGLFEGGYGSLAERVEECRRMAEIADVITCASDFIAQRAGEFHPRAVYLPDSIDGHHFRFRKPERDFQRGELRAIWSGISSKASELEPVLPLLHRHGIPLVVISDRKPRLSIDYRFIRWSYKTFPRRILDGEICVAPRRTDNPYDRGHSLFKIGVFMAGGVPVIASPVPSYTEVIGDGKAGVLCQSPDEWDRALGMAVRERDTLIAWSGQAGERMKRYYTEHVAEQYVALFRELSPV